MIKRVLIANRGEIALRIVHGCREMGVETVAVYSDADVRAPHVAAADASVHIGPAPALESYLSIERLIDAARRSGADAVHPGYGFLSQNPSFASACEKAGIVFIGPPASVLAQMGSKIAAAPDGDGGCAHRARRDAERPVGRGYRRRRGSRRAAGSRQ